MLLEKLLLLLIKKENHGGANAPLQPPPPSNDQCHLFKSRGENDENLEGRKCKKFTTVINNALQNTVLYSLNLLNLT